MLGWPHNMSLSEVVDLSLQACADQVSYVLIDKPATGIRMLDAWGRIPDGVLSGHFVHLGDYDQCVNISEATPIGTIRGKYCLVKVLHTFKTFWGYGACVPEACDYQRGQAMEVICNTRESYSRLDDADCTFLAAFALVACVILLSTVYDWYTRRHELTQNPRCILFSVLTNGAKLFETAIAPDQISCLAGIRVLSMVWIIAAHRYLMMLYIPVRNSLHGLSLLFSHESMYVQGAYLAVDTFLYIGGFVLAYQCFKNRQKVALTVPTIPHFYMHRLLRLLPPMTMIFFVHITILRRMSSGPLYMDLVETIRRPCIDHWLSFFLFAQNYLYSDQVEHLCLAHTWYLDIDLQLYLFTPLLIIPANKYLQQNQRFKCYSLFVVTLLASMFIPMIFLLGVKYRYQHAHPRIFCYVMGLLMGLIMVENKDKRPKIPNKIYVPVWAATISTMGFCMYYVQNTQLYTDDHWGNAMFFTFGRPAWCWCISWIIFCCVSENAKILNRILSNAVFIVVGRLSYSMYLLQMLVLVVTMGATRTPLYVSFWEHLHASVCDIVIITLLSIVCVLAFESPIIALTKLLFSRREPGVTKKH